MDPALTFCSVCAHPLEVRVPPGDSLPRASCAQCGTIHYRNPRLVVGCLPVWEERVLLCKRAIEPRYGKWTLPAGFMENGESLAEGAMRETLEEAGARVKLGPVLALLSVPEIHQVHVFHRAELLDLNFAPGEESLAVALYAEEEIPWDELAFPTVKRALRHFFADRRRGCFELHEESLRRETGKSVDPR
jgi:ADP-ribose pyrophosphatase YjhB (NUDIX family)